MKPIYTAENSENVPMDRINGSKPQKSGVVFMTGRGVPGRARLVLSVYCTLYERFAVLSHDKALCKDCGYINLKNCVVKMTSEKTFQVIPRECHAAALTFTIQKPSDLKDWLEVLQCSKTECPKMTSVSSPLTPFSSGLSKRKHSTKGPRSRRTLMPALQEEVLHEEEEEEESSLRLEE